VFKRRQTLQLDALAKDVQARLDEQSRQLRVLSDAVTSLAFETGAGARESRGLELLIATQLDLLRGRLAAVTEICELLGEHTEMDRVERRRLTDALLEVTREQRNGIAPGRRQVGVTVFAIEEGTLREQTALGDTGDAGEFGEFGENGEKVGSRSPSPRWSR